MPTKSPEPALLSGGNPQIAKGDGDAVVQAYIAAMPGWKQDVGRQLDVMITGAVADVEKSVKWNTPFYAVPGKDWFLAFHCTTKYVKIAFAQGARLEPMPPVESKKPGPRYLHIHEGEAIDKEQFVDWVKQAVVLSMGV